MPIVELSNGLKVRVVDTGGAAPTVVLIHGLANSIEIWDRVLPRLAARFRVVAFDLPGFGESDRPDAAYDAAFFADQLTAVLDALQIGRAHLVGSSLGASVIVRFSCTGLDRIDKAVLAAPGGFGRETHPLMRLPALPLIGYQLARPTRLNNTLTIRLAMHDQRNATPDLIDLVDGFAKRPGGHRAFARSLQTGVGLFGIKDREAFAQLARQFDRPALVVWGKQDRVFPVAQSERAVAVLPRAERLVIDRCGHYPQWEQPDAFAAGVETFLA